MGSSIRELVGHTTVRIHRLEEVGRNMQREANPWVSEIWGWMQTLVIMWRASRTQTFQLLIVEEAS